jgi:phosphate starvation-inducible PhoH-like protein
VVARIVQAYEAFDAKQATDKAAPHTSKESAQ